MNTTPALGTPAGEIAPEIADHVLLRRIGQGAYGEVWLARNMTGAFRAVKVIHRRTFSEERPFQREFEGICRFEPVSRSHPGLVTILHVGQNSLAGYFYYVMEVADDTRTGQIIDINSYVPKTLREELANHPHLPLHKRLEIALSLASALEHLHGANLIHRDIKPANIIFVTGLAKFADVGLMVEIGDEQSSLGTRYFMPPEGPGAPTGDIFSLGKVFYELFMGLPAKNFPELPGDAEEFTAVPALLKLNNLVLRACHTDPKQRFQTAGELRDALLAVTEMVHENGSGPGPKRTDSSREPGTQTPASEASSANRRQANERATPEVRVQTDPAHNPKSNVSRRGAIFVGLPTALVGAFFLGRLGTAKEPTNNKPVSNEPTSNKPVSNEPTSKEKEQKWQVLYDVLDDKLACFMGYIGSNSPQTKFLIYSRGTDRNWITNGFQEKWVKEIEGRFPALSNRVSTMTIEKDGWDHESFENQETAEKMRTRVNEMLRPPEPGAGVTPGPAPVLVLMDTTAPRGVYDDKNKGTGVTNAEVLRKQLQDLPHVRIYPEHISIDSSKRHWRGEQIVLGHKPALVIIHRSAFFHPVNSELGLGYPPF